MGRHRKTKPIIASFVEVKVFVVSLGGWKMRCKPAKVRCSGFVGKSLQGLRAPGHHRSVKEEGHQNDWGGWTFYQKVGYVGRKCNFDTTWELITSGWVAWERASRVERLENTGWPQKASLTCPKSISGWFVKRTVLWVFHLGSCACHVLWRAEDLV